MQVHVHANQTVMCSLCTLACAIQVRGRQGLMPTELGPGPFHLPVPRTSGQIILLSASWEDCRMQSKHVMLCQPEAYSHGTRQ